MRVVLLALSIGAIAGPAAAQNRVPITLPGRGAPPPTAAPATMVVEPVAMMIAACDADHDAVVTRDEMAKCVERSFKDADTDHKGSIGFIAYGDWAAKWLGDANAVPGPFETDTDNDNRITLAEMEARFDAIFDRLDRDHDGKLTRAELLTIRANPGGYGDGDRKRRR